MKKLQFVSQYSKMNRLFERFESFHILGIAFEIEWKQSSSLIDRGVKVGGGQPLISIEIIPTHHQT